MGLKNLDRLELPPTADMHVHLRQDKLMELVTPQTVIGGADTVLVMVCNSNLKPGRLRIIRG
jgi:dihydroorotase